MNEQSKPPSVSGSTPMSAPPESIRAAQGKKPRDPRLDFFRGLGMMIILIAHVPQNLWTLWIPARFGFSDATEIFVFCSGMASAVAFASVFDKRGWWMGTARVAHRVWQVYWCHIALFFAIAATLALIDVLGNHGDFLKGRLNLLNFFERDPAQQLIGLFTLTYVPNYFDILPMYIVILMLLPIVVLLARYSPYLALGFCALLWTAANVEEWFNWYYDMQLTYFRFPAEPWNNEVWATWYHNGTIPPEAANEFRNRDWFFNPFAWQMIFFLGFAFMRGWIPAPPVNWKLITLAAAFAILSLPLAYFRIYGGALWDDSLNEWLKATPLSDWRNDIRWLRWKTDLGLFRILHFLSIAYLAWVICGEGGKYLKSSGIWGTFVKMVQKVGQQSLAIFMFSMWFSWVLGYTFLIPADHPWHITARGDEWRPLHAAIINIFGLVTLVGVAYTVAWFKGQPWRGPKPDSTSQSAPAQTTA